MREQGPRNRDKETDENRKQRPNREFRPVRYEPERRRPAGLPRYDDDKVGFVGRLSCLNGTWARKGSASMKFEWANLLPNIPDISGFSLSQGKDCGRIFSENDNVGFSKRRNYMCPTEPNDALTSARYDSRSHFATTEPLVSLKNDHKVMYNKGYFGESPILKSSALMNSSGAYHGEYYSACKNIASVQYEYSPQNCFRASIVDSTVEKIESSYSSHKVLDHCGGLDNKVLNIGNESHVMQQDRECFKASIVDSIVEKLEGSDSSNKVLDNYGGLNNQELNVRSESCVMEQDRECSGYRTSYVSKGSQAMEKDGESSGSRGFHVECGSEVNLDCRGLPTEKGYGSERDGRLRLAMSNHDHVVYENVGRSKQMVIEEEPVIEDSLRNFPERGRVEDLSMIAQNPRHQNDVYGNEDKFQQLLAPTVEPSKNMYERGHIVDLSMVTQRAKQKISFSRISSDTVEETASRGMLPSPSFPGFMREKHSSEPVKPSNINIKKRLGHASSIKERLGPVQSVKKRLGHASSIKERLGPVQSVKKRLGHVSKLIKSSSQVTKKLLMPALNSRLSVPLVKQKMFCRSDLDDLHGGGYVQGSDSFEVKKKHSKNEKHKHSQKFEQLVHNAYMKFVKTLNENQAQERKFTEQGTSTLKCNVCGSFSKEFGNTLTLANHAFMTKTAGLRAEHLGFHKALCVLMGWNDAANSKGAWSRQTLPDSEALALKQDLIIWPPVVFIHNSSVGNANPDKQMIESIEELWAIIRGMGFGRAITKVCCGRAANQSIMVVNFHGTFSGLQEAESLHKLYTENKRGRAEFQQVTSQSKCSSYKVSSFLYGYLGIAEDLDKLNSEAKNRCFVRSKKEIQAIVDDPLDSEC